MSQISERLQHARAQAGFDTAADAARNFGWVVSTYSGHENGSRGVRADVARKYANSFRVSPEWLLFGKGPVKRSGDAGASDEPAPDEALLVAVYDVEVSAGYGQVPAEFDVQVGRLAFPPDYLRRVANGAPVDRLAIVTVKGDSMAPTLRGGDVVLIDTTKTNLGFDGLFVLRMDGALHIKRVSRGGSAGVLRILSDNREMYPPAERGMDQVEAVGKVLWYGRKE